MWIDMSPSSELIAHYGYADWLEFMNGNQRGPAPGAALQAA